MSEYQHKAELLQRILAVSRDLHYSGTLSTPALKVLFELASRDPIACSAETGAGVSTLILSHCSADHRVFALDAGGGSVANAREASLLRRSKVTFIEGPSQQTLPSYVFDKPLQLILIDGPHAYPFPDLEYYYLYPHLEAGGLLVLDDIHIPTVCNLFEFLRADAMFRLERRVRSTAFFRRTSAPVFEPTGDGWWAQRRNSSLLLRYHWQDALRAKLNQAASSLTRIVAPRRMSSAEHSVSVDPLSQEVGAHGSVRGEAAMPKGSSLWVLVRRHDQPFWWPQAVIPGPIAGPWKAEVKYGEAHDAGWRFEIAAIVVRDEDFEPGAPFTTGAAGTPVRIPAKDRLRATARCIVKKRQA